MASRYGSHFAPSQPQAQFWRTTGRALSLAGLLLWGLTLGACAPKECAPEREACPDTCRDEQCPGDQVCLAGRCSASCNDDDECPGSQLCSATTSDHGTAGNYCSQDAESNGDQVQPSPSSEESGPRECRIHRDCLGIGVCLGTDTGKDGIGECAEDDFPRESGQFDHRCLDETESCADGFRCESAGEGDTDSYCTVTGCQGDSECPLGYYCDHREIRRPPCESQCGLPGEPSDPECLPSELFEPGVAASCGDNGIEFNRCLRREFCSPCESDADCAAVPNQICARNAGGSKTCTELCAGGGCPWGSATRCAVWDDDLGLATCSHQAGSCRGDGSACAPCMDDNDCPKGFCAGSDFTGERFCIDESARCSCPEGEPQCSGGGCPLSPDGLEILCVPLASGEPPSVCYAGESNPNQDASALSCWAAE